MVQFLHFVLLAYKNLEKYFIFYIKFSKILFLFIFQIERIFKIANIYKIIKACPQIWLPIYKFLKMCLAIYSETLEIS